MKLYSVFRKRWFWVGVLCLFIFSLIFDISAGLAILYTSLASGRWDQSLLMTGIFYSLFFAYTRLFNIRTRLKLWLPGKIILLICAVWAFRLYGYLSMIYFLATIIILSRFLGFAIRIISKRYKVKNASSFVK